MKHRRALVTGGTGFVGSRLSRRLAAEGWEVHLVVRRDSGLDQLEGVPLRKHVADGTTQGLVGVFRDARPDVVFHLASLFLADHEPADVEPLIRSNVLFGAQVLESMTQVGVRYLVNTGTSWQHLESRVYAPVCLYAATKQAFEQIVTFYVQAGHLCATTLKLFDTYGPGDPRPKLFRLLETSARDGRRLLMSSGEQLVDLVHVEDAVRAFLIAADLLMARKLAPQSEFAVSSGSPLPLRQLVELHAEATGLVPDIEWGGRPYRPREVMVPWTGGTPVPGWAPQISLWDGLRGLA